MSYRWGLLRMVVVTWGIVVLMGVTRGDEPSPAGLALESIFNPDRAPAKRTMGLLQRSFLDLVESSEDALEVALVVDGTDSMAADIEGVRESLRKMVADLRNYRGDDVTFGLVVYRDEGAPSGKVTVPLKDFTTDVSVLEKAFAEIQPETGAPYFPEVPDLAIHRALTELPWSDDPDTTRWLILFADAPPYDPDFEEEDTGARRWYDTDILVDLARRKQVQVSCILCTSREREESAYKQTLDKTRAFMNALASGTDGLMLDLSYPDIQASLVEAAKKPRAEVQRIGQITREDVEAAREAEETAKSKVAVSQRLRLAVLPHVPLQNMTFDPEQPSVQIATELREKFRKIPGADVASPVDVQRSWRRVGTGDLATAARLQALAVRLRVDYVVWGSYREAQGIVQVRSALYDKRSGQKISDASVLTSASLPETQVAGSVVGKLLAAAAAVETAPRLAVAFGDYQQNEGLRRQIITPVSNSVGARTDALAALESLEQALAFETGNAEGVALLKQAARHLERAVDADPRNPFVHLLQASCSLNLARHYQQLGDDVAATKAMQAFSEALKRAYRDRDNTPDPHVTKEIEADYQLLIRRDCPAAIQLYEELARVQEDTKLHPALRAHWMLAGIYSGDWGVDEAQIDPAKARGHLIAILAHWEDSPEAAFIKRHMRWNEEKGKNLFAHFPRSNEPLVAKLASS